MLAALTDAQWGLLATTVVAVAGIVGQVVLARQRQAHEQRMAAEDRHQRRREDLYITLVTQLRVIQRALDSRAAGSTPVRPVDREEWRQTQAKVNVLGSVEMRDLMREVLDCEQRYVRSVGRLDRLRHRGAEVVPDFGAQFDALLSECIAIDDEVEVLVRRLEDQAFAELSTVAGTA